MMFRASSLLQFKTPPVVNGGSIVHRDDVEMMQS